MEEKQAISPGMDARLYQRGAGQAKQFLIALWLEGAITIAANFYLYYQENSVRMLGSFLSIIWLVYTYKGVCQLGIRWLRYLSMVGNVVGIGIVLYALYTVWPVLPYIPGWAVALVWAIAGLYILLQVWKLYLLGNRTFGSYRQERYRMYLADIAGGVTEPAKALENGEKTLGKGLKAYTVVFAVVVLADLYLFLVLPVALLVGVTGECILAAILHGTKTRGMGYRYFAVGALMFAATVAGTMFGSSLLVSARYTSQYYYYDLQGFFAMMQLCFAVTVGKALYGIGILHHKDVSYMLCQKNEIHGMINQESAIPQSDRMNNEVNE